MRYLYCVFLVVHLLVAFVLDLLNELPLCGVDLYALLFQQMEEQLKTLIVLSHYLEVHTSSN
jgi:hypothetical protein